MQLMLYNVDCRTGSSEKSDKVLDLDSMVDCRTGSSENKTGAQPRHA